jgi:hypothetical protein
MDLESFIITVFCTIDDFLRQSCPKLRQRGPAPTLADSEVLTIEAVGEFLHIDTDRELYAYFRRHCGDLFPGLLTIHRTTFARQAANLWVIKSRLWRHLTAMARQDPALALIDSLPVPVCHFARAHRCRGFPGIASFGHDALAHQTSYGLRLHLCVTWPFWLHLVGSTQRSNEEALQHHQPMKTMVEMLAEPEFWYESFQDWQSAFLSIAGLLVLGIYLRERGSLESKSWPPRMP